MKKWNIEISDLAYYPGVEANSADEALLKLGNGSQKENQESFLRQ